MKSSSIGPIPPESTNSGARIDPMAIVPCTNPIPGNHYHQRFSSPSPIVACTHGPGYRFAPTDAELILHYLNRRIRNEVLAYMHQMKDVSFYDYNPEELAEILTGYDNVWYCFTKRNRKYPNGSRPNRVAKSGYWKATGADRSIKVDKKTVGFKKVLVFYRGKKKTDWIMYEYRTADPLPREVGQPNQTSGMSCNQDMTLDEWVLYRFYERKAGCRQGNEDDQVNGTVSDDQMNPDTSSGSADDELNRVSDHQMMNRGINNDVGRATDVVNYIAWAGRAPEQYSNGNCQLTPGVYGCIVNNGSAIVRAEDMDVANAAMTRAASRHDYNGYQNINQGINDIMANIYCNNNRFAMVREEHMNMANIAAASEASGHYYYIDDDQNCNQQIHNNSINVLPQLVGEEEVNNVANAVATSTLDSFDWESLLDINLQDYDINTLKDLPVEADSYLSDEHHNANKRNREDMKDDDEDQQPLIRRRRSSK